MVVAGKLAASAVKRVVTLEQVVAEWQLAPPEKARQVARARRRGAAEPWLTLTEGKVHINQHEG